MPYTADFGPLDAELFNGTIQVIATIQVALGHLEQALADALDRHPDWDSGKRLRLVESKEMDDA
jgi:hypothetical protein